MANRIQLNLATDGNYKQKSKVGWLMRSDQLIKCMKNTMDNSFRAVVHTGKEVGVKGQRYLRIVVDSGGQVLNAFPVHTK